MGSEVGTKVPSTAKKGSDEMKKVKDKIAGVFKGELKEKRS